MNIYGKLLFTILIKLLSFRTSGIRMKIFEALKAVSGWETHRDSWIAIKYFLTFLKQIEGGWFEEMLHLHPIQPLSKNKNYLFNYMSMVIPFEYKVYFIHIR